MVAVLASACSSPPNYGVACQTAFDLVGPTFPTTIPLSSARDLLRELEQAGNGGLASAAAELHAALTSGSEPKLFAAVGNVTSYCSTHNIGTPIT